jgi:hypothetical protein
MTKTRAIRHAALACGLAPLAALAQAPQGDVVRALETVEVLGQTPLPG